jgi:excinuclease ABC subunit A
MQPMARSLVDALLGMARRLLDLGLGYLGLDRAGSSLSTGERQRVQLSRAVRNETTGVLYVLDEPSIGLHPSNIKGLQGVIADLLEEGNSVVMVDHDPLVLREADHLIEIGPGSGKDGGSVVAEGSVAELDAHPDSRIGPYLTGRADALVRTPAPEAEIDDHGRIRLLTSPIHTVHTLETEIPRKRLTVVTGVSGSGKSTLVLDSLVPALKAEAAADERAMPSHVRELDAGGIERVNVVDATPIGINVRSTVATYSGVLDDLRRAYARLDSAKDAGLTAGDFSYNTGSLRCPKCEGTGEITLDVQFLPDVDIPCPNCEGRRYSPAADEYCRASDADGQPLSLPDLLAMTVAEALPHLAEMRKVHARLRALQDVGLGYLTLHEATPALSGGEAQRLKLATELGKSQQHTLFVFDEPTVGLHPEDVRVLVRVFQQLLDQGGTVLVIEHDLDMIANADWIIDLGPGGGQDGGQIVATGTPQQVANASGSVTGEYLKGHLNEAG